MFSVPGLMGVGVMGSLLFKYPSIHLKCICPLITSTSRLFPIHKCESFLFTLAKLPNAYYLPANEGKRFVGSYKKEGKQKFFSYKERQVHPTSVFAAGTAKRTAELMRRRSGEEEQEQPKLSNRAYDNDLPDHPLTPTQWKTLKENAKNPHRFEIRMMVRILSQGADINVAKSLLTYVALEEGTLSYELMLRYLTLCVHGNHHSEVFDVYDIMTSHFKTLDTGAYSLLIKGFSRTERWKETLLLLKKLKKLITPSPQNYADAIGGAVQHGDSATAWALYDELLDKGVTPNQESWLSLFESGLSDHGNDERLESILNYMRDNQVYPQESLAKSVKAWFESLPGNKWKGKWSSVEPSGVCRSCQSRLESIQLTEEEYGQLKDMVMKDVIQGKDVFNKTTPEELERFKTFVKRRPPFDVVIDGLNVANTTAKGNQSETLLAVVSELEQQGLRMLVLGRQHMLRPSRSWDRRHMNLLQQKADCFFTENISEDDPFLLYATLHSGNHCNFVSRDLMRDHKACLPDSATRRLFFKWQRGHQLVLNNFTPGRKVRFERIQHYDTIVQTNKTSWHIPYDEDGGDRCSYEVPQKWLCLTTME
ncbi:mitochondrial ribonuclease P catalytic subunit [Megalops cyprinoides]|uniref:mitochondrial ribonuclease P catalytic subunit n=1 Tax=Megalops cyprinoides TaxID=118141 RepID=UPI001864D695|nr:mitochondrial ribonuclease P catalytic subunit [Megalops cyprinoides]